MTFFISDIGSNHNGNYQRALDLIKKSRSIGANAVKFQMFDPEKLWTKKETVEKMSDWALPGNWIRELSEYARSLGLKFCVTPFYLDAVAEIKPYVDFYKIGSYEGKWDALINKCMYTNKPLVISCGLLTVDEIAKILKRAPRYKSIALLHCNSSYPAKPSDCKLYLLDEYKQLQREYKNIKLDIGWSDHTACPGVIYSAVGKGAQYIEFHLDLDGVGNEFEYGHCWLPDEIQRVISIVRGQMEPSVRYYSGDQHPDPKLVSLMTSPKTGRRPY